MGRPKMEKSASMQAAIAKRRAGLFKKAHELAVLCSAEVAIINFSAEGRLYHFASSNAEKIIAKFKKCSEPGYRPGLQSEREVAMEQVAMEIDVPKLEGKKCQPRQPRQLYNILNLDLEKLNLLETFQLKGQIFKGMLSMMNTKEKLFQEKIEESKKEKEKLQQDCESLLRQVQELEASRAPPVYYPVPVSMYYPQMAGEGGFHPWANYVAPSLAITSGHETEGNFQYADKASSLPSTSTTTNDHVYFTNDSAPSMPFGAAPLATQNNNQRPMSAFNPYPQMAGEGGFHPWANYAAPSLAITSGHETEGNFQYADKASSLPSTSTTTSDHVYFTNDSAPFMPFGAAPLATQNSNQRPMSILNPYLSWLPHGYTGAEGEPMIVPSCPRKNK